MDACCRHVVVLVNDSSLLPRTWINHRLARVILFSIFNNLWSPLASSELLGCAELADWRSGFSFSSQLLVLMCSQQAPNLWSSCCFQKLRSMQDGGWCVTYYCGTVDISSFSRFWGLGYGSDTLPTLMRMPGGAIQEFRFQRDFFLATVISTYREEDAKSCESVMLVTELFTSEVTFHNLSAFFLNSAGFPFLVFQSIKEIAAS